MNTQNLPDEPSSTAQTAAEEARKTKDTAVHAGSHLASAAQDEARSVAAEAGAQVQGVASEFMGSLHEQAGMQQQKLAEGLRALGSDLNSMADSTEGEGDSAMAGRWVREAATRADDVAIWLEQRDPGSLVDEVKRFARRRPGVFLGIAVGAGLLAGRLTRSLGEGAGSGQAPRRVQQGAMPQKVPPTPDYVLAAGEATPFPPPPPGFGDPLEDSYGGQGGTGAGYGTVAGAGSAPTIPPAFPGTGTELGPDGTLRESGSPLRGTGGGSHD